jgi:hypothetical protein
VYINFGLWPVSKLHLQVRARLKSPPKLLRAEQLWRSAAFIHGGESANSCSLHALKSPADIRIPDPQTLFALPFLCARACLSPRADFFPLERRQKHFPFHAPAEGRMKKRRAHTLASLFACPHGVNQRWRERKEGVGEFPPRPTQRT